MAATIDFPTQVRSSAPVFRSLKLCAGRLAEDPAPNYARLGLHYVALYGRNCTTMQLDYLDSHYQKQLELGRVSVGTLAQLLPFMLYHDYRLHGRQSASQRKSWVKAYADYAVAKVGKGEQARAHMPEIIDAFLRDIRKKPSVFAFYDLSRDDVDYAKILAPARNTPKNPEPETLQVA